MKMTLIEICVTLILKLLATNRSDPCHGHASVGRASESIHGSLTAAREQSSKTSQDP